MTPPPLGYIPIIFLTLIAVVLFAGLAYYLYHRTRRNKITNPNPAKEETPDLEEGISENDQESEDEESVPSSSALGAEDALFSNSSKKPLTWGPLKPNENFSAYKYRVNRSSSCWRDR